MAESSHDRKAAAAPGGTATKPTEIPREGWLQIAKRGWKEAQEDQVPLLAAGVAFYAFLAIFPAVIALVLLYGLFADPATITEQVNSLGGAIPAEVRQLIIDQVNLSSQRASRASIGVILSIAIALWSASGGVSNLVTAISTAYDEREERGFVKKRLLALGLTLGAIVFMVVMLGLVAVVPAVLSSAQGPLAWLVQIGRWVVMALLVLAALAVLYRVGPDRDAPKMRWVSVGAIVATVLFLAASAGFSLYVAFFGNYAKTYGALAGIVVLLFWLWITSYAILLGAEVNAETEQQTIKDSTKGPEKPLGSRGAVKADSVPDAEADEGERELSGKKE